MGEIHRFSSITEHLGLQQLQQTWCVDMCSLI